jgi:hypothetical protein
VLVAWGGKPSWGARQGAPALTIADPVIDRLWRSLESEAPSRGDGDDPTSEDDQAGHDH